MIDLSKLNPPETAPDDGRQFLAWGIDEHAYGYRQPDDEPRWCIVQFAPSISAAIRSGAGRFPAGQPASMSLDGWRFHGLTAMVIASWRNPLHKGSI